MPDGLNVDVKGKVLKLSRIFLHVKIYKAFSILIIITVILLCSSLKTGDIWANDQEGPFEGKGTTPENGFVPDKKTAVKIAEAVWSALYGESHIERQRPFIVELKNGVWYVKGSLNRNKKESGTGIRLAVGGVAYAKIRKSDGRILFIIHYK